MSQRIKHLLIMSLKRSYIIQHKLQAESLNIEFPKETQSRSDEAGTSNDQESCQAWYDQDAKWCVHDEAQHGALQECHSVLRPQADRHNSV